MGDSAQQQMDQMCKFIYQEAQEKVNEIRLKTQNDANMQASMLVHEAKNKIQADMKVQEQRIKTEQKVQIIRVEEDLRRKKMFVRDQLLDEMKAEGVKALQNATKDQAKYKVILTDLIVQGLIKMNEPKVAVIVRECDKALAESVISDAASKYSGVIKKTVNQNASVELTVNPDGKCLPPAADGSAAKSCAGGVKLMSHGGRLVCDNTLDARLATAFEELMPEVRSTLFTQRV